MAGLIKVIDSVVEVTVTTFKTPRALDTAHSKAAFMIDINAITGTWNVTVRRGYTSDSINIARLESLTTPGVYLIPLAVLPGIDDPNNAFPEPNEIEYTLDVGPGTLSADLVVNYGD